MMKRWDVHALEFVFSFLIEVQAAPFHLTLLISRRAPAAAVPRGCCTDGQDPTNH